MVKQIKIEKGAKLYLGSCLFDSFGETLVRSLVKTYMAYFLDRKVGKVYLKCKVGKQGGIVNIDVCRITDNNYITAVIIGTTDLCSDIRKKAEKLLKVGVEVFIVAPERCRKSIVHLEPEYKVAFVPIEMVAYEILKTLSPYAMSYALGEEK